jgi:cytochrome c
LLRSRPGDRLYEETNPQAYEEWLLALRSPPALPGNPAVCYRPRLGDDGMMTSKISRIIAPVILLFSGPALAQPDTRRGLSLAREHCAQCHAIDNASESPLAAAPPFRDLHLKYAVSDLQRPLTQGPHTKFRFEPSQIEALMAYLKTLGR